MNESLAISLIHLNVRYKEPETNRKRLIELNSEAARHSRIIVNTEMAVSGYSFQTLNDIADYVEPENGPTLTALKGIARESGSYICIGFAEVDEATGMYFNAAHVIGPDGDTVCRYRKINAEARWACPGQGTQNNTFDTPWGRVGVLICSDSYYGLMPRQTALRGARMILVPANWPVSGMDPRNIWKARAMENGVFVAACNRGGADRIMSCETAWSCAYTPQGEELMARCSDHSSIMTFEVPLEKGQIPGQSRQAMIKSRKPEMYRPIYLDMRHSDYGGGDFTSYYDMPQPGPFTVTCLSGENRDILATLSDQIMSNREFQGFKCFLLPRIDPGEMEAFLVPSLVNTWPEQIMICAGLTDHNGSKNLHILFHGPDGRESRTVNCESLSIIDTGPLRVGICHEEDLCHPETAVAASKLGCDLLLTSAGTLDSSAPLLFGVKSVEQTALAVAGTNMAFICEPPKGHAPWRDEIITQPGVCSMDLDSARTRNKRFQDRVDFDVLLQRNWE